jgi:hypothetical protein
MKSIIITSAFVGLMAAALGSAPGAPADSLNGNAADVVKALQDKGYNVQYNMPSNMALARCTINGVHGLPVMMAADGNLMAMSAPTSETGNVFVDLNCPSSNN